MAGKEEKFLDAIEDTAPEPAPEPAAEATEAAPAAEADQGKPEGGKPRKDPANAPDRPEGYVPRQALDQARIEAREELKREREERQRTEERFQKVLDKLYGDQPQPGPADDIPDPTYDPNGYLAWDREQKVQQRLYQQQQQQQERAWSEAYGSVQADFNAARQADPDLWPAYQKMRESLALELHLAYGLEGQALAEQLEQTEAQHVMYAHQNRIPIAKYIRGLAQARGWAPGSAQAGAGGLSPGAGNDAARAAMADGSPVRDPATGQFTGRAPADIAMSQERNISLSQAPGAPVKRMTPKELAQLPEEEMFRHFDAVLKRPGAKQFDRDMGYF